MSILNWQTSVQKEMDVAFPGHVKFLQKAESYLHAAGDTAQETVINIGTATEGDYSLTTLDNTVTVPATDTDTAEQIRDKLINALKNNQAIYSSLRPLVVDTDTFKLVARDSIKGIAIPVSLAVGGTGYAIDSGSSVVAARSGEIKFGVPIARRSGDPEGYCRLPTASTDKVVAIAIGTHARELSFAYQPGQQVGGLKQGEIYVPLEEDVTPESPVYYRYQASGNLNVLGALSGSSGTGKAQLSNAEYQSRVYTFEGQKIALLSINKP